MTFPLEFIRQLPRALDRVAVPEFFSPSRFAALVDCRLQVIHGVSSKDQLASGPTAQLGTAIHRTVELAKKGRIAPGVGIDEAFAATVSDLEKSLASDPRTSAQVPLQQAIGSRDWLDRVFRLKRWAVKHPWQAHGRATPTKPDHEQGDRTVASRPQFELGAEARLRDPGLRLAGRTDDLVDLGGDTYEVRDFKSGRVLDEEGQILREHTLQLRLYALLIECLVPGASVRLVLEGAADLNVGWDDQSRADTLTTLRDVLGGLPSGAELDAHSAAVPGGHCRFCPIRHVCPAYREAAPRWWGTPRSDGAVAPWDVWGRVLEATPEARGWTVLLLDDAGRHVRLTGIDRRHGIPRSGERLWFFGLEPTETVRRYPVHHHPRNFHELPPAPIWKRAWTTAVFRTD